MRARRLGRCHGPDRLIATCLIRRYPHLLFLRHGRQRRRLCDQRNGKARPVQPSGTASQAVRQASSSLACVIRMKGHLASSRFSQASSVSTLHLIRALIAQGGPVRLLQGWGCALCADALPGAISRKAQEIYMRTGCGHHTSFLCIWRGSTLILTFTLLKTGILNARSGPLATT